VDDARLPPRYRRPERIARGGMGEIFRAEDAELDRTVAIKVLADRYADDPATRERFTREALAAARLSHAPSTVTIFDVGEHEGRPYIVMEYLPGGSLADRLSAEGLQPVGRSLEWLREAAAALDAAHASGIVHRDVKPANLLLDDQGRIKVADFGVASAAHLSSMTETGTVVGTAGYLSPEQARGERATDASDRYALAVVAFELLTGTRPFERESSTAEAMAHVSAPIPAASTLNPELPPEVDEVLARGLAKEPRHRYGSAAELVHALRAALDEAAGSTRLAAAPVQTAPRRRFPVALALVGALVLGAGILAAALLAGGNGETAGTTAAPKTVKETVTLEGTTVVQTVTTAAPAPTPPPTTAAEPTTSAEPPAADAAALNDEGFALMQAGNYEEALPLLEQAVQASSGSGELVEAYASYNLAFTRFALGDCTSVAELLDRSEQVQGQRKEIDRLRRDVRRSCDGEGDDD
jgi:eukaryotic-like serine/threonine-protein kinase